MSFIKELKQRNVFRVGIAYVVVAWLLLQLADIVLDNIEAPAWVFQTILLLLVIGFPLALIFAWAFELTPEGIKKEKDVDRSASVTPVTGRKLDFFIIGALALALVFVVIEYVLPPEVSENQRTIAVLPFDNRSAEEEDAAFLADGVHDELLTRLSKIHDLRVTSRTSVMEYRDTTKNMRQIGAELGVGSILEGGVQRAGNTVRINVQLIDAQTDEHLWAETYDEELTATNLFEIQTEISTEIANALRATLSPDEQQRIAEIPTENIEALQAFFAGNQMVDRRDVESLQNAIAYFDRAIKLDPEFAGAYAGLAEAWLALPNESVTTDWELARAEAAAAAQKAIALDPDSADALAVLGWYVLLQEHDWPGAEQSIGHALVIEPTNTNAIHWYRHLLSWQGHHARAIEMAQSALAIDPLSRLMSINLADTYSDAGQWDEAISIIEGVQRREHRTVDMRELWTKQLGAQRVEDAAATLEVWAARAGYDVEAAQELGAAFIRFQQTGVQVEIADDLIQRLQLSARDLARVYAHIGDKEKTIEVLQVAHLRRTGTFDLFSMKINPSYDFIRDDPRFVELLAQIGLAD